MSARVAILHGAGYTGGELIRLLLVHSHIEIAAVTSRSFAGRPVSDAHPALTGVTPITFSDPGELDIEGLDAVFVAAEHGQGAVVAKSLVARGFEGAIVDLSADFRLPEPADYEARYEREHPAPELAGSFEYGMADLRAPYPSGTRRIANPGCFATGLATASVPVLRALGPQRVSVTALTGASGSGARPKAGTHFPTRDGNVRAYKVLAHQHVPEVVQLLPEGSAIDFVPVSGPWTRGIWGTLQVPCDQPEGAVTEWFEALYGTRPLVRLWPGKLPELRWSVGTPFIDVGWVVRGGTLVVGFGLDNLLKGASAQALQNLNLIMGWPETLGLLPNSHSYPPA